jgi:predicted O-linked N-acetylglucosamine transferase (SPINDLY family)
VSHVTVSRERLVSHVTVSSFLTCEMKNRLITPEFTVWMEGMRVNRGAVLWLPYVAQHAIENLQKQCLHYGIHRSRLVFSNQSSEAASDARGETRF